MTGRKETGRTETGRREVREDDGCEGDVSTYSFYF